MLRKGHGWTQAELGEKTDYAGSTISKAENYHDGDGMTGVRISIIEEVTGKTIEGPFYREAA
jgi:transcriptional regulator with XRE-family HTH domain